jgi:hypothetical protein
MQVVVRLPTGGQIPLEVDANDRSEDVKRRLQARVNLPVEGYYLKFGGRPLRDGLTLGEFGIQTGSTLDCS